MSTQPNETEVVQPEQAAPSLSIQDLIAMLQIITVVSQRGAVRAEEMSQVGTIYDKLVKFLEANGAISRAEQPATPPPQES